MIQQNLNSNIQSFLACLGLIVATMGVALVYYVKITVNKRVEKELTIIKNNLKLELKNELLQDVKKECITIKDDLHSNIKSELSKELLKAINENREFYRASGSVSYIPADNRILITGLKGRNDGRNEYSIVKFEVMSHYTYRKIKHEVASSAANGSITLNVTLLDYEPNKDGPSLEWRVVWVNENL